jgi:hypothetical protein
MLLAVLALAVPASGAGWQQFRNDPAGDGQSSELGAQSAAVVGGSPINLPARNAGVSFLNPGQVVVLSGFSASAGVVLDGNGNAYTTTNTTTGELNTPQIVSLNTTSTRRFVPRVA